MVEPIIIKGDITIQLESFLFPIIAEGGFRTHTPMTLFLIVDGQKSAETLCRYVARVREAVSILVDQNPIVVSNNKYQLGDINSRLRQAVNKSLPIPLVIRLHLFPLPRKMGQGAEILKLGGSPSNCKGLKKLPDEVQALVSGDGQEAKTFTIPNPKDNPKKWKKSSFGSASLAPPEASNFGKAPPAIPTGAIPVRQSDIKAEAAPEPGSCQQLSEVWSQGFHEVSGRRYWLDQAFTLDDDANGIVDNIGFILKAEDRPDLYIYYFPVQGKQSVITVPTLRLADERGVLRACFGRQKFNQPGEGSVAKTEARKPPDLAAKPATNPVQSTAEHEKISSPGDDVFHVQKKAFFDGPGLIFIILAGAGVLIIIGGGIGYAIAKRRSNRRREERRQKIERRDDIRRQRQQPSAEGSDQRTGEDRRKEEDRREDEDRRDEEERRQ